MKLKIHPLFFILAIVLISIGQAHAFVCAFLAVFLHEMAHAFVAKMSGYHLGEIVLLPFGAVLFGEEKIEKKASATIAVAGPVANFVLALFTLGVWWLFPVSYDFTKPFLMANLVIGVFNLFPVFPLDGSRIVLAFSKNKLKALKILKFCGILTSVLMMVLFVVSAFYDINFTLGIMAMFLFLGATSGTEKEMYEHVSSVKFKDFGEGVENRKIKVLKTTPLRRLVAFLKPKFCTDFEIVDKNGHTLVSLTENDMRKIMEEKNLDESLEDAIFKTKTTERNKD